MVMRCKEVAMSGRSPSLSPRLHLAEVNPLDISPSLDDFVDSIGGPSLLGKKIFHSPESDVGSATHQVSFDVLVEENLDKEDKSFCLELIFLLSFW